MSKTILITGGTGFIGSNINKKHLKSYDVYYLTNRKTIKKATKKKIVNKKNIFNKIKSIDYLIHLAGVDDYYKGIRYENINKDLDKLLKKIILTYKPKKTIFTSTNRVYENTKKSFVTENTKTNTLNRYAKNKLVTEKILKKTKFNYIVLRLPSVISKKFSKGLIFRILEKIKKNEKLDIFNPNSLFNNIVHVDELIDIIFYSLKKKLIKNLILNISSAEPIKLKDVVNLLLTKTKSNSSINILSSKKNSKYYSTKLQKKMYGKKISSTKKTLLKLFR